MSCAGEAKREGSSEEPTAPEAEVETNDAAGKEQPSKDTKYVTSLLHLGLSQYLFVGLY